MLMEVDETEMQMIIDYRKKVQALANLILYAQKHWKEQNE